MRARWPLVPPHCAERRPRARRSPSSQGGKGGGGFAAAVGGVPPTRQARTLNLEIVLRPMVRARHLGRLVGARSATSATPSAFVASCGVVWRAGTDWARSRGVPVTGGGTQSNTPSLLIFRTQP